MARKGPGILCRDNEPVLAGPLEDIRIRTACQTDFDNSFEAKVGLAANQSRDDVGVEILIDENRDQGLVPLAIGESSSQTLAQLAGRISLLDLFHQRFGFQILGSEHFVHSSSVPQVVGDRGIHIGQVENGILQRDLLCGGSPLKSDDYGPKRDPGSTDSDNASVVGPECLIQSCCETHLGFSLPIQYSAQGRGRVERLLYPRTHGNLLFHLAPCTSQAIGKPRRSSRSCTLEKGAKGRKVEENSSALPDGVPFVRVQAIAINLENKWRKRMEIESTPDNSRRQTTVLKALQGDFGHSSKSRQLLALSMI